MCFTICLLRHQNYLILYACLNKCFLRAFLKVVIEQNSQMEGSSSFQSLGPHTLNARSPYGLLVGGSFRKRFSEDRR